MTQEKPLNVEEAFQVFETAVAVAAQDNPNLEGFFGIEDIKGSVKVFSNVVAAAQDNPNIKELFNVSSARRAGSITFVSEI
jgi:hypothetical protein